MERRQEVIRWFIPGFFGALFLGLLFLLIRNGAFLPVDLKIEERSAMSVVAIEHVGPYHRILSSLEKVEAWAKETGRNCDLTFGRFLDDPDVVDPERLRSHVGCVTDRGTADLPESFFADEIPAARYVVGVFRGSPALGPYKVYGKASRLIHEQRLTQEGPVVEIYRVTSPTEVETQYLFRVK